jgi:hypothetical protein
LFAKAHDVILRMVGFVLNSWAAEFSRPTDESGGYGGCETGVKPTYSDLARRANASELNKLLPANVCRLRRYAV